MTKHSVFRLPLASLAALGLMAAVAVPAFAASSDVPITLPYNRQVFSNGPTEQPPSCVGGVPNPAAVCTPFFDLYGDALPSSQAPKPGPLTATAPTGGTVTFQFPSVSGNDSLSIWGQESENNIPVTPGNYSELDLLAGAGNGPSTESTANDNLKVTLTYSNGTTSTQSTAILDWYHQTYLPIKFAGRWAPAVTDTSEQMDTNGIGPGVYSIPVNPADTLTAISVTNTTPVPQSTSIMDVVNILAATLVGTSTGSAPSSTTLAAAKFVSAAPSSTATTTTTTTTTSSTKSTTSSTASTSSTSVPKTGAGELLLLEGAALVLFGGAGALWLRRARHS